MDMKSVMYVITFYIMFLFFFKLVNYEGKSWPCFIVLQVLITLLLLKLKNYNTYS